MQTTQTLCSESERYFVMGFGLGGNQGHGINWTSSWYARPEELQSLIDNGHYPSERMEGCIVIDKIAALKSPNGVKLAMNSPLCDPRLHDDEIDRFADAVKGSETFAAMLASVHPTNAAILSIGSRDTGKEPNGLDKVSPTAYAAWWKRHGARLGVVKNGRVIWED
jgi:hypothetical protein